MWFHSSQSRFSEARDAAALAAAKSNVEKHYAVVGLQEDLLSFLQVLGALEPPLFLRAAEFYLRTSGCLASSVKVSSCFSDILLPLTTSISRLELLALSTYLADSTRYRELATLGKILPSKTIVDLMKKNLALEYDFYKFIKRRFYEQKASLGLSGHICEK